MSDIEKEIIENLTDTERENIGDILKALKDEDKKSIINCINNCTSPQKLTEQNLTQIQTIFNAFNLFPISETQILILGQDPYPEEKKAHGLAFSVKNEYTKQNGIDDSLFNIFTAIEAYKNNIHFCDLSDKQIKEIKGTKKNKIWTDFWKTDLTNWAKNNGVLLLNTALTYQKLENVTKKEQKECQNKHINAWKPFVFEIVKKLTSPQNNNKLVVFLWGRSAQATYYNAIRTIEKELDSDKIKIMRKMIFMTSHPSNNGGAVHLGFCKDAPIHFKACDDFLCDNIWKNFPESNEKTVSQSSSILE